MSNKSRVEYIKYPVELEEMAVRPGYFERIDALTEKRALPAWFFICEAVLTVLAILVILVPLIVVEIL